VKEESAIKDLKKQAYFAVAWRKNRAVINRGARARCPNPGLHSRWRVPPPARARPHPPPAGYRTALCVTPPGPLNQGPRTVKSIAIEVSTSHLCCYHTSCDADKGRCGLRARWEGTVQPRETPLGSRYQMGLGGGGEGAPHVLATMRENIG